MAEKTTDHRSLAFGLLGFASSSWEEAVLTEMQDEERRHASEAVNILDIFSIASTLFRPHEFAFGGLEKTRSTEMQVGGR